MWGNPVFGARARNTWPVNFNVSRLAPLVGSARPSFLTQLMQAPLLGASCLTMPRLQASGLACRAMQSLGFRFPGGKAALRNESGG